MRPDQITDFFKNFMHSLERDTELPRELREKLNGAKQVNLSTSLTHFAIQFTDENGNVISQQYSIQQQQTNPMTSINSGGWEILPPN